MTSTTKGRITCADCGALIRMSEFAQSYEGLCDDCFDARKEAGRRAQALLLRAVSRPALTALVSAGASPAFIDSITEPR